LFEHGGDFGHRHDVKIQSSAAGGVHRGWAVALDQLLQVLQAVDGEAPAPVRHGDAEPTRVGPLHRQRLLRPVGRPRLGVLDFAGGTVVHINAGFAALAAALVIGKRNNLKALPPHNLPYTLIGAAMLWFGWFGFNAGSALAADGIAANAFMTTNVGAAAAALMWPILDKLVNKRSTILGTATGAVVGLVAITPAAGYVSVVGAFAIGAIASAICFVMVTFVKERFGYDDALDAFGCHGIGGLVGALLTGVFADPEVWKDFGGSYAGALYGNPHQFFLQLLGSGVSIVIAFVGTFAILKLVDVTIGLRVGAKEEAIGLDISLHHERAYTVLE